MLEYQAVIGQVRDEKYLKSARGWCDLSGGRPARQVQISATRRGGRVLACSNTSLSRLSGGFTLMDVYGRPKERNLLVTIGFEDEQGVINFEQAMKNRGYKILGSKTVAA